MTGNNIEPSEFFREYLLDKDMDFINKLRKALPNSLNDDAVEQLPFILLLSDEAWECSAYRKKFIVSQNVFDFDWKTWRENLTRRFK